jgi:hypothetical protein
MTCQNCPERRGNKCKKYDERLKLKIVNMDESGTEIDFEKVEECDAENS